MNRKLVITNYNNKIISMLIENNREQRIEVYDRSEESILDNVYIGRVKDIVANINAAFVEISSGAVCYFSLSENSSPIFLNKKNTDKACQGDLLLVQVKKAAIKTKAPVVSSEINLPGKYCALTREKAGIVGISRKIENPDIVTALKTLVKPYVTEDYGYIVRTDASAAAKEAIIEEIECLKAEYERMVETAVHRTAFSLMYKAESPMDRDIESFRLTSEDEIVTDVTEIYEDLKNRSSIPVRLYEDSLLPLNKAYSIESRIEKALDKHVWLKSGGYLIIEPTEALTVIDVNTGKFDGNGKDKDRTFFKTNMEAADEIARQLVIRNITGIIIIDFVNLKSRELRNELEEHLKKLIAKDSVRTAFVDFTKLDLVELTRKKVKKPLHELL